ncbi:hypothetical protein [Streptomyces sp. NPDC047315]|uniref:hypothetical protein n=1 Tax=Streptomyces sp. NPDC047315 TaxID=3155142 RepID=UPI0033C46DB2
MSPATDTPSMSSAPARGMNSLDVLSQHMLATLKRGGADMSKLGIPPQPEPADGLWEHVSVPQLRARRDMWTRSVREASHDEYLRFRFEDLDPNQKPNTLRNWLNSLVEAKKRRARPEVLNMIVPGPIGSGKTAALCAVGNEAADLGLVTRLVKHSTYLTWRRPDSAPHNLTAHQVRERFVTCDLLILDEFCGEMDMTATQFARRETTDLIDSRLAAGRPTAYSTNLRSRRTPEHPGLGVVDILGEQLLSRLEASAHLVKIQGPDRRKPAKPLDW